jgi:SAM-dependent methyltransferase
VATPGPANPGGSATPTGDDLALELRRYRRTGGDHADRYRWAAPRIRGSRWLDVGCGHGFGPLLPEMAPAAFVGVDVDPEAIAWAQRVVVPARAGTRFLLGDHPPAGETFDVVTCFEVVEHVSDPAELLRGVVSACRPGGWVFLSTPNGSLSRGRPEWFMSPFHRVEYALPEFAELVARSVGFSGAFWLQRRWDALDWAPAALRARLLASAPRRPAPTPGPPSATPRALARGHAAFRTLPSPASLWRRVPVRDPHRERQAASHLLWAGQRPPAGRERSAPG